jgi:hypothetical protein
MGWGMNTDIVLLGAICIGLGGYCLHLQWKYRYLLRMMQFLLEGLKNGDVEIIERNGVFLPIAKKQ